MKKIYRAIMPMLFALSLPFSAGAYDLSSVLQEMGSSSVVIYTVYIGAEASGAASNFSKEQGWITTIDEKTGEVMIWRKEKNAPPRGILAQSLRLETVPAPAGLREGYHSLPYLRFRTISSYALKNELVSYTDAARMYSALQKNLIYQSGLPVRADSAPAAPQPSSFSCRTVWEYEYGIRSTLSLSAERKGDHTVYAVAIHRHRTS